MWYLTSVVRGLVAVAIAIALVFPSFGSSMGKSAYSGIDATTLDLIDAATENRLDFNDGNNSRTTDESRDSSENFSPADCHSHQQTHEDHTHEYGPASSQDAFPFFHFEVKHVIHQDNALSDGPGKLLRPPILLHLQTMEV